jgi:hypothetical protein
VNPLTLNIQPVGDFWIWPIALLKKFGLVVAVETSSVVWTGVKLGKKTWKWKTSLLTFTKSSSWTRNGVMSWVNGVLYSVIRVLPQKRLKPILRKSME